MKEADLRPGDPAKNVKLDDKRSYWKGAAEPRSTAAADTRAGLRLSAPAVPGMYNVELDGKRSCGDHPKWWVSGLTPAANYLLINNVVKPSGREIEFVPSPKMARPEGGCVIIHRPRLSPLPFWLKRNKYVRVIKATKSA